MYLGRYTYAACTHRVDVLLLRICLVVQTCDSTGPPTHLLPGAPAAHVPLSEAAPHLPTILAGVWVCAWQWKLGWSWCCSA